MMHWEYVPISVPQLELEPLQTAVDTANIKRFLTLRRAGSALAWTPTLLNPKNVTDAPPPGPDIEQHVFDAYTFEVPTLQEQVDNTRISLEVKYSRQYPRNTKSTTRWVVPRAETSYHRILCHCPQAPCR